MDWKRNDIHRIVVFEARLHHVTSGTQVVRTCTCRCTLLVYLYACTMYLYVCTCTFACIIDLVLAEAVTAVEQTKALYEQLRDAIGKVLAQKDFNLHSNRCHKLQEYGIKEPGYA